MNLSDDWGLNWRIPGDIRSTASDFGIPTDVGTPPSVFFYNICQFSWVSLHFLS